MTPGEDSSSKSQMTLTSHQLDQESVRKDLAMMIVLHEYPLSMFDHYGFRKFCNNIQPLFKVASRNTIKKDIFKMYDVEKEKTMKLLNKNRSRIAITSDLWTASNQNKGYMTITAHFIDNNWVLQSRLIRFVYVPCPHTRDVLAAALMDCFYEWNIDRKLSTLTLDNCSTNDAVVEDNLEQTSKCLTYATWFIVSYALLCAYSESNCSRWIIGDWTSNCKNP
ncbi:hypothetical protein Patl1_05075 [Pistacia atlantica]|uniref:Uncharacterized protein n=1 Tax=Pistacia atlantica TaxID=434234 RepID=A0ACC1BVY1_9ROSI|nr:hypothetical protein Patl1_05075 [Pistacia atlantica]